MFVSFDIHKYVFYMPIFIHVRYPEIDTTWISQYISRSDIPKRYLTKISLESPAIFIHIHRIIPKKYPFVYPIIISLYSSM